MADGAKTTADDPRYFCDPGCCRLVGLLDADGEPLNECPAGYCYGQDASEEALANE